MIKSMTGFGRCENQNEDYSCKTEIRSVNNRYIDINTRFPKSMMTLDATVKKLIKSRCSRGSFDLNISIERTDGNSSDQTLQLNLELADQYRQAFKKIKSSLELEGEIDINLLLSMKDVVKVEAVEFDPAREELIHATVEDASPPSYKCGKRRESTFRWIYYPALKPSKNTRRS